MSLFLRIAVWLIVSVLLAGSLAAQPLPRTVLFLDQSNPSQPWYVELSAAFRSTLTASSMAPITVYARNSVMAAQALVPGLKRIALVGDLLERQTYRRHFKQELPIFAGDLGLIDLTGLPMSEIRKRVAVLPENTAIIYTAISIPLADHVDCSGVADPDDPD